jgi:S1-C subfamily serine protease
LRSYGAPDGGVLVTDVTENGPAKKAGMEPADVIVEIDG